MLNPNDRDAEAYERASAAIREAVPGLVYALWQAGAIEAQLLDAARALLLQEARHTEEARAVR
jgi:hypothetical protein